MALTKSEARSLVRQWLDDPDSSHWSDTNLDLLLTLTLDDLWSEILRVNPRYRSQLDTVSTLTSPGYIDLRLSGNGGDLSERLFRVQSVVRDAKEYSEVDPRHVVIEDNEVAVTEAPDETYYVRGDLLWLFPLETTPEVELRYAHRPARFDDLSDSADVPWPEGHESAYVLEAAGRAMLKGGREDASDLLGMARAGFERALAEIESRTPGPRVPMSVGTPEEWGGIG